MFPNISFPEDVKAINSQSKTYKKSVDQPLFANAIKKRYINSTAIKTAMASIIVTKKRRMLRFLLNTLFSESTA